MKTMFWTTRLVVLSALLLALQAESLAQTKEPFSEERFESLQAKGKLILIDIFAGWCPVCIMQQEILADYQVEYSDTTIQILVVDYDEQPEWVAKFRAPRQSTLILYRGKKQLWMGVAEMRREVIFAKLNEAVSGAGN